MLAKGTVRKPVAGAVPYEGRRTIVELLRLSQDVARAADGVSWLRAVADEAGAVLVRGGWIPPAHKSDFRDSVAEMIEDMQRNDIDIENLSIEDLGMFASPDKALRLMTIHEAKGREFAAVAIIGVKEGSFPYYKAKSDEEIDAEKRQFYVAVTRAEQLLMYIYDRDRFGNPPSRFLGPHGVDILK